MYIKPTCVPLVFWPFRCRGKKLHFGPQDQLLCQPPSLPKIFVHVMKFITNSRKKGHFLFNNFRPYY